MKIPIQTICEFYFPPCYARKDALDYACNRFPGAFNLLRLRLACGLHQTELSKVGWLIEVAFAPDSDPDQPLTR